MTQRAKQSHPTKGGSSYAAAPPPPPCRTFGFLLIDGFALMAYSSVIEPFRAANVLSGKQLYRWVNIAASGEVATASSGARIISDASVGDPIELDMLFVIAGGDPTQFDDPAVLGWIRRLAHANLSLAGISGGPVILARAGVLGGFRCTVHWEHAAVFEERYPHLNLERGIYVIDRARLTCAGGTAGLDLSIELIERDHGHNLSVQVSDWFIRTQPRSAEGVQRLSLRERYSVRNDAVLKALARMEATVEEPESRIQLAARAGVSLRQLERLFKLHLGRSIAEMFLNIRLNHAEAMLRQTGLSVTEVAVACGFTSSSHFARVFKQRFGRRPSQNPGDGSAKTEAANLDHRSVPRSQRRKSV